MVTEGGQLRVLAAIGISENLSSLTLRHWSPAIDITEPSLWVLNYEG